MQTISDVHQQFAEFFQSQTLKPFAYLVSKKLAEGHICVNLKEAQSELDEIPFYKEQPPAKASALLNEAFVSTTTAERKPFVLHNQRLYLQRYFEYETQILERIRAFILSENKDQQEQVKRHAEFLRKLTGTTAADAEINWQLLAAITGATKHFSIITGGPGTGKTTSVSKILALLYAINPKLQVALAAPTGKAAVRMAESLKTSSQKFPQEIKTLFENIVPATIHRLLKPINGSPYFKHDKNNPLPYDLVIVDECSMIDAALFAKLLRAIGSGTKLILLGDKDQLASVEAGSLFGDLCKSQPRFLTTKENADLYRLINNSQLPEEFLAIKPAHILAGHIVELQKSYRFSSEKGIGRFSQSIINGKLDDIKSFLNRPDEQVAIDTKYDEAIFEQFISGYREYIAETDIKSALKKLNDLRVLCAVRSGDQGLQNINKKIEKYLTKHKLIKPLTEFYEHRPIIVTRNYYELELYNGDVGIIRADENNLLKAWFEDSSGNLKSVTPGFLPEAETVFAMTIHKSQGSEYERVMVILPSTDMPLLTAELLYTGVTRAKTNVTIQATENVLLQTAQRRVKRASGIIERFDETGN